MKKFLLVSLLFSASIFAVLPPYYQSVAEIDAILKDERLHEKLGSEAMIDAILRDENGYFIISGDFFIRVAMHYLPQTQPGPTKFELELSDKEPLNFVRF